MGKANIFIILVISALMIFPPVNSYSQKREIKAGIAKIDITPSESLYMGGYDESCRMDPSDGHSGKIYIRALAVDDGINRIVLVEADIVSLPADKYPEIREMISKETKIPAENVLLGCVHNHAAPVAGGKNIDSQWYSKLNSNFILAAKKAISDLEPVIIGGGTGKSNIAMNRRKKMEDTVSYLSFDENNSSQFHGKYKTDNPVEIREVEGVYRLGANPSGKIDDEVGIMRIDKLSGQPKAVIVNYACHGTSLGARNNTIDSEWNGHMLEYVEKQVPGVTGIFIQGAAGDINPRFVGGLDGYKDNLENTAELGYEIGKEVLRVYSSIKTEKPVKQEIKVVHQDIVCPKKYGEVMKDFRSTTYSVPVTAISFDEFVWITIPGELFHEIGQVIKSGTHARFPFLVGYCNGSFGYIITQEAYSQGGYEPWATRFAPVTEKILVKGIEKMLLKLL